MTEGKTLFLKRATVFVDINRNHWRLPRGTPVRTTDITWPSPFGLPTDRIIFAPHPWGGGHTKWHLGWIGHGDLANAELPRSKTTAQVNVIDRLREIMASATPLGGWSRKGEPIFPQTPLQWWAAHGSLVPEGWRRKLLTSTFKVTKGIKTKPHQQVQQIIQLITQEKVTMSTIEIVADATQKQETAVKTSAAKQKAAAKKATAKKTTAKKAAPATKKTSAPKAESTSTSMLENVGTKLVTAMKGIPAGIKNSDAGKRITTIATSASKGKASHKQLEQLRDAINEVAYEARDADKGKAASELSSLNRLVRRLERAAR